MQTYYAYLHFSEKYGLQHIESVRQMKSITSTLVHVPGKCLMLWKETQTAGHMNHKLVICGFPENRFWTERQF